MVGMFKIQWIEEITEDQFVIPEVLKQDLNYAEMPYFRQTSHGKIPIKSIFK